jgi:hypothetical protein
LKRLKQDLTDCLEIKWQEGVKTIVGVKVQQDFTLQQNKLIEKMLKEQ